ncbi:MAG: HEAT repeat domain-containing protein [Methanoregula sp.]
MGEIEPQVSGSEPAREQAPEEIAANEERRKRLVAGYIQLLKDKNLNFRWRAAEALGESGDPEAVEPLIEALRDPFVDVQWLAAKSLGKMATPGRSDPFWRRSNLKISGFGSVLRGDWENFATLARLSH